MRLYIIIFFILFYTCYAKDSKDKLTETERKNAIVACANSHLESCEKLLNDNVPNIQTCNVRTECEFVGWLYIQVQDYTQSLPYLKKACDSNHKESCDKLGFSYQRLNNYKKAKKYYKIACNKGSMSGCYNLSLLYHDGLGVRHSYEMANMLFEKICDNNEGLGCLQLGIAYKEGYGVIQNQDKAKTYFEKGCTLGNNESCDFLDAYQEDVQDQDDDNENDFTEKYDNQKS
ncbi:tetratricopeptide repeat protein [Helicobacter trogontum]|uniref:Beta-lactamase n=1 Tax=Helicobacter trogontum TaxID=50960 RepID=A0A4U8SAG4_9HELI|nr:tetratricopeptide repeat protein [Helicobacter trogontum]TLD83024.1 sel1 repeat family protein [Helicobacter trogontum]